jgi:hypothetical protein
LKGKFYKEKGYPLHYKNKEEVEPARVFRYTQLGVIKGGIQKKSKK